MQRIKTARAPLTRWLVPVITLVALACAAAVVLRPLEAKAAQAPEPMVQPATAPAPTPTNPQQLADRKLPSGFCYWWNGFVLRCVT